MIRPFLKPVALVLAVGVFVMLGATTGAAFVHEVQHAAHHTGMHGSGICAWMCASAGGVITPAFLPAQSSLVQPSEVPPESQIRPFLRSQGLEARAPPALS